MPGVYSDGKFFESTVTPLLAAGRESDLCEWLKKNDLIAKEQKCLNTECLAFEKMQWQRARVIDKFNWVCLECKKKLPARHASFFADFKCELGFALRIIDGKCTCCIAFMWVLSNIPTFTFTRQVGVETCRSVMSVAKAGPKQT